jgi:low affinity Fe/Cu permease
MSISKKVESLALKIIAAAGSNLALGFSFGLVALWAVSGVFFDFSQKWASIIGTLSSVITILMVFLIQKTQNKDSLAIQLKLIR